MVFIFFKNIMEGGFNMPAICVSIKSAVYIRLEQVASQTGFTKSKIAEKAFEQYFLGLEEDRKDAEIGAQAWTDFVAEGKKGKTLEEFEKELDS
jgi:predicted transcriptional regulator